jgi:hypothetical protein
MIGPNISVVEKKLYLSCILFNDLQNYGMFYTNILLFYPWTNFASSYMQIASDVQTVDPLRLRPWRRIERKLGSLCQRAYLPFTTTAASLGFIINS